MKRIVFLMAGLTAIVAVAVVLTLIIVNALRTPVNGPVRHYDALFTDASGLIVGNDVRISGVQVGKVEKIHLDGKNARITFNVLTDHPLYQNTTVAIRYQSLVGQRYVEIAQAPTPSAPLAAGTTIPLGQTIPSFDIAKLFNGFRPIFETLDPAQFNRLTENILQLIQGDERGIGPILRDIDAVLKLSVDRQAALQTIITNLGDISKDLGGTSDQLFYLINDLNDVLEPFEKQADEFNRAGADALPVLRRSVSLLRYIENSVDGAQLPLYDVASRTTPGTPTIMAGLSLIPDLVQGMRDALIEEKTAPPTAYECKNGVVKMPGIGEVSFANQDLVVCK
ncbi:Putative Mce family protein [Mycobacteroides abscessus subsp. abscessus]|uniref:Mce family protein n=5 Tax=Mycobacteroides abscessus TaxID=36809 RepID=B1MHM4_MYCA9|nr:MCE family protein [Mycobacteroides abscessus]ETZ91143.1 mce related family protein [Mycobacteroides abscessus MAB_030201_1075]ETZ95900.1 mce related family protein [Mycobacteroides abscessus MAB_030201_1061]AKP59929.1 mammalian cell entry protein [Mycobacteroides abscessus UC22]ALM18277.1 mammalian cell entry protein [Mycobacteroides abscessus]AMU32541.1 mammalian cell entry protein [Mycobacteroides abscessus]